MAGYAVHHARVIGRLESTTGIEPFARLVEQVMTAEPYASADRPSGWSGTSLADRPAGTPPGARVLAGPDRDLLLDPPAKGADPNDLTDLDALTDRVLAFYDRYNATATPFDSRFTRNDLDRIAAHETAPAPTLTA
ncbi:MAG: hypothetical protein H0T40_01630 [Geodermatophilaceae bacterium]|nr:hypothetical protein [Geodermatophilaceae bacterium]